MNSCKGGKGRRQKKNCRFSDICSNRGGGVWKKPNSKNKFNWDQILMGGGIQHFFQFSIEKYSRGFLLCVSQTI